LNDCTAARCGDGFVRQDLREGQQGFEACDDGNNNDSDACNNSCRLGRDGSSRLRAAASCLSLKRAYPNLPSTSYWLDPNLGDAGDAFQAFCEMELADGGWTLVSNRRINEANIESCGQNLGDFFSAGCGDISQLSQENSYSLGAALRAQLINTEWLFIQFRVNGEADLDDAFRIESTADLLSLVSGVSTREVDAVCNISGGQCDRTQVLFISTGQRYFHSSYCDGRTPPQTGGYGGNYGYCHNGLDGAATNRLFGDRSGYEETKLWNGPPPDSGSSDQFSERIFVR
jgi:cysteine-rich repeat protein